jgi:hypothetical protein
MQTARHRFIAFAAAAILSLATGAGIAQASTVLLNKDIDWSTNNGVVTFHLRFRNPDQVNPSGPVDYEVFVQEAYGAHVANGPRIHQGQVPPLTPDGFFDIWWDVAMTDLPPNPEVSLGGGAPADGPGVLPDPCDPNVAWHGNIDVTWGGPGGAGNVNKHTAGLGLLSGGSMRYVHLLTGCAGPISWAFGTIPATCNGFTITLVNEDYTPAPGLLPSGWTGWIGVQAAASVPGGAECCFTIDMTCGSVTTPVDLCARSCNEPTPTKRKRWSEVKSIYR